MTAVTVCATYCIITNRAMTHRYVLHTGERSPAPRTRTETRIGALRSATSTERGRDPAHSTPALTSMALRFAILTALTERESSGFELARRFDQSIGYFWSATHQQIYRELDRLNELGLVAEAPAPKRPERGQPRRFSITAAGAEALRTWVREIDEPTQSREALIVRLRAAAANGTGQSVRAAVAHHLQVHEQTYAKYEEIAARDFATISDDSDRLRYLVLKRGLGYERAWIEWCREVLSTLDAMNNQAGTS